MLTSTEQQKTQDHMANLLPHKVLGHGTKPSEVSEEDSPYVDPVLALYDANGVQIGFNDDGIPQWTQDSKILFRPPTAGTDYVAVESFCVLFCTGLLIALGSLRRRRTPNTARNS